MIITVIFLSLLLISSVATYYMCKKDVPDDAAITSIVVGIFLVSIVVSLILGINFLVENSRVNTNDILIENQQYKIGYEILCNRDNSGDLQATLLYNDIVNHNIHTMRMKARRENPWTSWLVSKAYDQCEVFDLSKIK